MFLGQLPTNPKGIVRSPVTEVMKAAIDLWLSNAFIICAAYPLYVVHVNLDPHVDNTFTNATVGGTAK
jgi:hypothetical protein